MVVESGKWLSNKKCEKRAGAGERHFPAAIAPFPKSCPSYFRFARFNTFPLYYLRAWHRLNEFMFQSHMRFCRMQWLPTRFYGSLKVYSRPLPSKKKNSPFAAQLKIAFRRFLYNKMKEQLLVSKRASANGTPGPCKPPS